MLGFVAAATWAIAACSNDGGDADDFGDATGGGAGSGADASTGGSGGSDASTGGSGGSDASTGGSSGSDASTGGTAGDGTAGDGGTGGSGGSGAAGSAGNAGGSWNDPCDNPALQWKSANKTHYESYPDPGSEECIEYNGCAWAGQFAYCNGTFPEDWVEAHNIASVFPSTGLLRHDLCLRAGSKTIVVTAIDTCGDSDCGGCCTQNLGNADRLIDLEKYTNARWGVPDGPIEWADLGENPDACE
jgi:hypothetical protein